MLRGYGQAPGGLPPPPPPGYGAGPRRIVGRIRKFDRAKGFGFLECADGSPDVFFLPSSLPKDMKDSKNNFEGMEMTFEIGVNDEGKPRAKDIQPFHGPPMGGPPMGSPYGPPMGSPYGPPAMGPPMGPMGPWMGPPGPSMGPMGPMVPMGMAGPPGMGPVDGQIFYGTIVRYEQAKGFGFIQCEPLHEDVFFLRSELPVDLREESKEKLINIQVEFEIGHGDNGKLRGRRLAAVPPQHAAPGVGRPAARCVGKILRFEDAKGYGFLSSRVLNQDIFFLRSGLPAGKRELQSKDLVDLDVSFEWYYNEEGKPRAQAIELSSGGQDGVSELLEPPEDGSFHFGTILRFEPRKGYGFLKPSDIGEDVYFERSQLPEEIRDSQIKDEIVNREVEFEVKTMPDGKMRALNMTLTEAGRSNLPRSKPESSEETRELEPALLEEMARLLRTRGGGMDYGMFASTFQKIKKKQLEKHFNIVGDGKSQRIELRDEDIGIGDGGLGTEENADEEGEPSMDDPAIPLGPGCNPHGVIRTYDAKKGFGFIVCAGFPEDIYFPRSSLPTNFQAKNAKDMPSLAGVQVTLDFTPTSDRGPRADRVTLLLKWHNEDRCWLLKRDTDPIAD